MSIRAKWDRRRWIRFAVIGATVFALGLTFEPARQHWLFFILLSLVGLTGAVALIWAKELMVLMWSKTNRGLRLVLICAVALIVWGIDVAVRGHAHDGMYSATIETGLLLLFLALYAVMSRLLDVIWAAFADAKTYPSETPLA